MYKMQKLPTSRISSSSPSEEKPSMAGRMVALLVKLTSDIDEMMLWL